jgi:hypothetical protein
MDPLSGGAQGLAGEPDGMVGDGLTRRSFVQRAAVAAALAQLPAMLVRHGLLDDAIAAESDLVKDTLNGFMAFVLPGDDDYSKTQGEFASSPGAIGAGTLGPLLTALDNFVPASVGGAITTTVPASGAVATLLNAFALQVDPAAANGQFLSPFSRLKFADKAKALELFEQSAATENSEFKFVAGIAPGFVGFLAASEAGVRRADGTLSAKPVGWSLSRYSGPAEGHAEFKGYYGGRRCVGGTRQRCPGPVVRKKKTSPAKRRRASAKARRA